MGGGMMALGRKAGENKRRVRLESSRVRLESSHESRGVRCKAEPCERLTPLGSLVGVTHINPSVYLFYSTLL